MMFLNITIFFQCKKSKKIKFFILISICGIAKAIKEGLVTRSDLWITSKLWNTYHSKEHVEHACQRSLDDLGIDYFDLRDLLSYSRIQPSVLQVEIHPYNRQEILRRFCSSQNIAVTAFSSLGSSSYMEIDMAKKEDSCMNEKIIVQIAKQKKKTPAQILLRWAIERNISIIPKTIKISRMKENIDIFNFKLSNDEIKINTLDKKKRFNDPGVFTQNMNSFCPIYD